MVPNRLLRRPGLTLAAAIAWSAIRDLLKLHGPTLGMRSICRRCGGKLTRAQLIRATGELEAAGLVHVARAERRGAGPVRNRRNRYTLTDPPPDAGLVERCENRTVAAPGERSEIRTVGESERSETRTVYGAEIAPSNGAKIAPCKEQQELSNNGAASPPPAAPPVDAASAAGSMLLAVGVDERRAAQLRTEHGLERVAAAVAWARERRLDNPAGFVVDVLTDPAKRPELERRAAAERTRREEAAAEKTDLAHRRAMREFVARLPDDQRRGLIPAAVDSIGTANPSASAAYRRQLIRDMERATWAALEGGSEPPMLWVETLGRLALQAAAASQLARRNGSAARPAAVRDSA
ncbi:MAG: hypothetical protein AMXMBFR47_13720 [Planctomycetota bacterium]